VVTRDTDVRWTPESEAPPSVLVVEGQLSIERCLNDTLAMFPSEVRDGMLDLLTLEDSAERARWIGRLYSAPRCGASPSS
jgi:hypothetical protein